MKSLLSSSVLVICLSFVTCAVKAGVVSTHGDWTAFKTASGGETTCYSGSGPLKDEGDYTRRGDIYVLVSHWPESGRSDEVSVEAGYDYQAGSDVTVKIGAESITMFTNGGNAWAKSSGIDKKLISAMKRGTTMVITGRSWRGTGTKDTYSLNGFTAAYNAARKACGL